VVNAKLELGMLEGAMPADTIADVIRDGVGPLGAQVAKCPKAPALKGSPSVNVKKLSGGKVDVELRWAGTWSSAGLPQDLKLCIADLVAKNPDLSSRVVGLQVARS
jgi:hypothetical protein